MSDTVEDVREVEQAGGGADDRAALEARARKMGWKPKDEYRGPAGGWRDADEFVQHGENDLPVLKENLRRMERRLDTAVRGQEQAVAALGDLTERFRTVDEKAYARAVKKLEQEREIAIDAGDSAAIRAADRELKELQADAPKPAASAPAPTREVHPDAAVWADRNPWFNTDPAMAQYARETHAALLRAQPNLSVVDNLERVTRSVKAAFPDKFPTDGDRQAVGDDNPRRREAGAVAASSPAVGPIKPKEGTFASLPADAKAAFGRYRKMLEGKGKPLTEQEWADSYYEQGA